jgi:hypothetical protein
LGSNYQLRCMLITDQTCPGGVRAEEKLVRTEDERGNAFSRENTELKCIDYLKRNTFDSRSVRGHC